MAEALTALQEIGLPPVRILVNNRKVAEGFYRGLGLTDVEAVLRSIDKLDKIGPDAVAELVVAEAGATPEQAQACLRLAAISGTDEDVVLATPLLLLALVGCERRMLLRRGRRAA